MLEDMIILYGQVSRVFFVFTVLFGLLTAVLFAVFDIPETAGILSGRTARKVIRRIREEQKSGDAVTEGDDQDYMS